MSIPSPVTESTFETDVLKSSVPVLVDFWAEWCGPCKMIAPVVDQLSEEYSGKVAFHKLDVDANPTIASKYGIRSIPTLLFFKDGKPVSSIIGAVPKREIKKHLDQVLV